MGYMNINRPLYPRPGGDCEPWNCRDERRCGDRDSWRMPLFDCECRNTVRDCGCGGQTVRLENPCCPGEFAEVNLSVDPCGNLVICIHKDLWNCRRPKKRC